MAAQPLRSQPLTHAVDFSEDPAIQVFRPHVAPTSSKTGAYVWVVGDDRAPDYWFPRQCPRAMAWVGPVPAEPFQPAEAAFVATTEVTPLGPAERVGDLFELHAEAGIQLRVLPRLHDFWDAVIASTLEFSGIRLRNAIAR
ncbi:MAG: hypothetical protein QOH84_3638 [Kribbellaceae bacterium]|nr:hypothetical protein [Kribbellaceae bacterium]